MNDQNQVVAVQEAESAPPMTVQDIKNQVQRIQEVMSEIMKPGVHYGTIPGTGDKPTLLKPGSEKLLSTFRIAVKPITEDLSTEDEIRYRVTCEGRHQTTGILLGAGVGECSSSEEKYKWRRAVVDAEWDETDPDRRRIKWGKKRNGQAYQVKQVRSNPSDQANTVLKMAKKRAEADLCLTALAASDIFAQDLEDLPQNETATPHEKAGHAAPQAASAGPQSMSGNNDQGNNANGKATEGQIRLLQSQCDDAGIGETLFWQKFNINGWEEMPFARLNEALEWIKEQKGEPPA